MKVHWTNTAIRHLDGIYDYIAQDSPVYAKQQVDRLTRRSEQIAAFPQSGRMVPEFKREDIREVIEGPYRLIYVIKTEQIDILSVFHGAQKLPDTLSSG
ncbi:type II toxin-antitoxin system RelE/ParE family toxin [Thiohalophilus sp.]|uniref:type II toxin-antitoxin system RelE/ParE family toxin n=1 Tax=Thiohalophilus sp. TaxID=3028392 RepID=UPI002ACE11E6|nr:type II toxin-antitoxin system RelE/ParE family toxin [Thiohalophilus sp.]MDZ7803473.1 type II toxin-antitoxin system RelE/ParE family toxin [Thiohalophilus sp.]